MTPAEALALAKAKHFSEPPGPVEDTARATGSGVLGGASKMIDASLQLGPLGMLGSASDALLGTHIGPERPPAEPGLGGFGNFVLDSMNPEHGTVQDTVEGALPGAQGYEPRTVPGVYGKTAGTFIGQDLPTMGFGGVMRSLFSDVAAGLLSEYAGRSVDPKYEPWARLSGALVGGGVTSGLPNPRRGYYRAAKDAAANGYLPGTPNGARGAIRGPISEEDLKLTTDAFYDHLRNSGIVYNNATWQNRLMSIYNDLDRHIHSAPPAGMRRTDLPADPVFELIDRQLTKAMASGAPNFNDLDLLSSNIGKLQRQAQKSGEDVKATAYARVKNEIDDYIGNANGNLVYTNGSAPRNVRERRENYRMARTLALRNIKQRRLSEMMENAQDYTSGFVSGLKQQINSELKNTQGTRFWSPTEREMLRDITKGNTPLSMIGSFGVDLSRWGTPAGTVGDLARTGIFNATLGLGASRAGMDVTNPASLAMMAGPVAVGTAANAFMPMAKRYEMRRAQEAVRGGQYEPAVARMDRETNRRRMRQLQSATMPETQEQQDRRNTRSTAIRG